MSDMTIETTEFNIAFPDAPERRLHLGVGACQIRMVAGEGEAWVSGTYRFPTDTLPARIESNGGTVRITQEQRYTGFWGGFDRNSVPRFDLALGKAQPFALALEVGANEAVLELGGLPLTSLSLQQGAGKAELHFSQPNPQQMSTMNVEGGAASFELHGLANANFAELHVKGGAAAFVLDFSGTLQRDARVDVNTGMAGVDILVPATTAVKVMVEAVLGGVDLGDGFMKKDGAYWNEAAIAGKTPLLTVSAKIALGGLKLRHA